LDSTIREWDRESSECLFTIQSYSGLHIMGCTFKNAVFASSALESITQQYGGILFSTCLQQIRIEKLAHLAGLDIEFSGEPTVKDTDASSKNTPPKNQDTRLVQHKHLVITGKNGSGKTILLNTINDCLNIFINNTGFKKLSFSGVELEFHNDTPNNETAFYANLREYFQSAKPVRYYFTAKNRLDDKNIANLAKFLSGAQAEKSTISSATPAYYGANQQTSKPTDENLKYAQIIKSFENSLKELLKTNDVKESSQTDDVFLEFKGTKVFLRESGKIHPLESLPHGFQALLGILGNLRLSVHDQGRLPETARGLVLIDEPELHLHVSLQKKFMPILQKTFPNIQFIIATHSPFILNSATNAVVYDLEKKKTVK